MKPASALRTRLVVGSFLWTIGLMAIMNAVILGLVLHRYPGWTVHFGAMGVAAIGLLAVGLMQLSEHPGPLPPTAVPPLRGARGPGAAPRRELPEGSAAPGR